MRRFTALLLACTWIGVVPLMAAPEGAADPKDQLAITALEGLMSAPAERALPLLKKVLAGQRSELVKRRALFVLSQIDQPEAQQLLLESARSGSPAIRHEAIRAIGIGGNGESLAQLAAIYRDGDGDVREAVLEAWMIADREQELLQVAMNAQDDEEQEQAIQLLGAMGASDALRQLSEAGKGSPGLIQAFAVSGDLESLMRLVRESSDPELRAEAVQSIGIVGGEAANQALRQIYGEAESDELREAALHGMLIADDEQGVLALYRASTDPKQKRELLRTLTIMGGDAAFEAIDSALEGRLP